jgi:hypothetical protein
MPYSPHTTSLYGKNCEQCHNNRFMFSKNALQGSVEELFFKGKILFGNRLDNKSQINTFKYKKIRLKELKSILK